MIDVSIIFVNYKTWELTKECIDSIIRNSKDFTYEIIVVDNNSNDGSVENLQKVPNVRVIQSDENVGFGRANNIGAKAANGKYLFLLNSDTYLLNNAIKFLFDYYERNSFHKNLGAVGCWLKHPDDSITTSFSYFPSIWNNWRHLFNYINCHLMKRNVLKEAHDNFEVNVISGADIFISKDLYLSIGGYDKDYFMYGEEAELQYRLHKQGYHNFLIKDPSIVHLEGASSGNQGKKKASFFMIYHMKKGRFLFYWKHKSLLQRILVAIADFPIDVCFAIIDKRFCHRKSEFFRIYSILLYGK